MEQPAVIQLHIFLSIFARVERAVISIRETVRLDKSIVPCLSAFFNIDKKSMLNVLKKFPFSYLDELNYQGKLIFKEAKKFIAACYAIRDEDDFSTVRYKCWKNITLKASLRVKNHVPYHQQMK